MLELDQTTVFIPRSVTAVRPADTGVDAERAWPFNWSLWTGTLHYQHYPTLMCHAADCRHLHINTIHAINYRKDARRNIQSDTPPPQFCNTNQRSETGNPVKMRTGDRGGQANLRFLHSQSKRSGTSSKCCSPVCPGASGV
jgi:hypothetical protein